MTDQNDCNFEEKSRKALEFIEDVTQNADEVQRRVLSEILTQNANVEYLQRHGLENGEHASETFKKAIPVITYEDLQPYVERIANGDTSPILCSQPIQLVKSSGTSQGKNKLLPRIEEEQGRRTKLHSLTLPVTSQFMPGSEKGKGMYFLFIRARSESTNPGGQSVGNLTTNYFKSKHFKDRPSDPNTNFTSLNETIVCPNIFQSMYSQMLCGLYQNEEVFRVGALFATGLIHAIRFLEKHWKSLCHDIRVGSLDPQIITDVNVREAVMRILKPNPSLADFIEFECSKDSWKGIITKLWPNAKYIDTIVTGTMAQYITTLEYYGNGLPLVSLRYDSTECFFGINLNPFCNPSDVAYTIFPTMAYFEFLHVKPNDQVKDEQEEDLVDLIDVKLGQEYEMVVTTYSGLYRYRVGDILRVAGFKNKAPQFTFVGRKNAVLSIDADKTEEVEVQHAVNNAVKHLIPFDVSLLDYTSYSDTSTIPGHYVLFWEISQKYNRDTNVAEIIPASVLEACCLAIEDSLSVVYHNLRAAGEIGALEIRVVEKGTFEKLMEYAITQGGASLSQYKTPKSVKSGPVLELLNSSVVSRYFSQKCSK